VATFVLVMQFLWKYIDEILGKGFTILELLELISYYSVTLIPLSVPITILISSVMVFGDMAEKYELSSMKSAGISLFRIMLPSFFVALLVAGFSLFASNYLKPAANLQFQKRFLALRKQKSALAIEEGIFNDAFGETIIRVNEIEKNGRDIHDVLIYDHTQNDKSLISITSAKAGKMYTAEEGKYFVMKLDTGIQYREMEKKTNFDSGKKEMPFMRTYFDQWTKSFDMSVFDAEDGILNFNRNKEDMLNTFQLLTAIDSFNTNTISNKQKAESRVKILFANNLSDTTKAIIDTAASTPNVNINVEYPTTQQVTNTVTDTLKNAPQTALKPNVSPQPNKDSLRSLKNRLVQGYKNKTTAALPSKTQSVLSEKMMADRQPNIPTSTTQTTTPKKKLITQSTAPDTLPYTYFVESIDSFDYRHAVVSGLTDLMRDRDELMTLKNINYDYARAKEKYLLRMNQQYSWSAICIIFLFIGAPLGSIIRKGGYGYPLLVAILFYMIFIINTILGEKLVKNESMTGIQAAWLPCMILLPFAVLLTFMALKDLKFNPMALFELFYSKKIKRSDIK
jgi:lipopolysaccharide export system permease protein